MDYRHTEDFARRSAAAALRAPALRRQAADAFWHDVFAALAGALRALRRRLSAGDRAERMLPEA